MFARLRQWVSPGLAMLGVLAFTATMPHVCRAGDESFQEAIQDAAKQVLNVVKGQPLSIGQITPNDPPDANAGPGIAGSLKDELERIQPGVVRTRGAPFTVKGDYSLRPHPDPKEQAHGQKVLEIDFRVISTQNNQGTDIPVIVFDNTSIARLFQISGPLPTGPPADQHEQRRQRNKAIQENVQDPKNFIDEKNPSRISTSKDSPYQLEILAGPRGDGETRPTQPRPARIEEGLAFVEVRRGELYEVRVYNRTSEEVAIRVFIDGLGLFHFSDDRDPKDAARPKYTYLIVPPAKDGDPGIETIPGWHKSIKGKENFLAFLVTEYGKGAASKEGIPASGPVGVIQVQFSRCYAGLDGGRKRSASNETGFGPPREVGQAEIPREVEPPIDVVSVRYTR
jgi:hypothetical protein